MKKILVFVNSFNYGGVTSLIQNIYRNLDHSKYEISFLRPDWNRNDFDREVIANGDKVYYIENERLGRVPVLNYYIRQKHMIAKIKKAVGKEKFDTAYIHANAVYCIPAAKALGIKNIIMHSHEAVSDFNGNEKKSKLTAFIWKRRMNMYNRLVNFKLGVSKKAIIAKFGEKVINNSNVKVVYPSINMERFNPEIYGNGEYFDIDSSAFNMIHVGRLSPVKNQSFLIDILEETAKKRDAHLYIVGEGDKDKEKLTNYANEKGVGDKITFLAGNTSPEIYKKMNCSLLPSFSESFGMVAVESQLMGVPCFASTNVPTDVDAGMCTFIDLEKGAEYWAKEILAYDYKNVHLDEEKTKQFEIGYIINKLEGIF